VRRAVIVEFGVAQVEMVFRRVILRCCKLAMQLVGTDIRSVLVAHPAGVKRFVWYRERVFARLGFPFPHRERVLPDERFVLKADELDDYVIAHGVPETDFSSQALLRALLPALDTKKGRIGVCQFAPFPTRG